MTKVVHWLEGFVSYSHTLLQLRRSWFPKAIRVIWILFFVTTIGIPLYIYMVIKNPYNLFGPMPSLRAIENPENDLSSELISADGVSLGRYFRYNRSQVTYDELSPVLVNTLIISEDHRFYQHAGMDFWSYLRVVKGILTFDSQGGGSTLTQQTAKNLFHTREKELQGKLSSLGSWVELLISKTKEWIIAVNIEKNLTKQEIITLYLNTVPFNNNAYGIKIAAETYFSKSVQRLSVAECALLVGMLQGTQRFNPIEYPERAQRKRNDVLQKLHDHGVIKSQRELDSLRALPLQLSFRPQSPNEGWATYFRSVVREELLKWCKDNGYNLHESGLKIYTTIDSRMQYLAEQAMAQHMKKLQTAFDDAWGTRNPWITQSGVEIQGFLDRKIQRTEAYKKLVDEYGKDNDSVRIMLHRKKHMKIFSWQGAKDTVFSTMDSLKYYNKFLQTGMLSMNPRTGEVKAWVGGIDHHYFKFDHVRQSARQAGSTFKPFVYGKAIEDGYTPCYMFRDISPSIKVGNKIYRVRNSDASYGSGQPYTLRQALARSLNSITMQVMEKVTPSQVVEFAHRVGVESKLDPVYSLALGTSNVTLEEMVAAYCSFVNLGIHFKPYYITRIEDKYGKVIQTFTPKRKQVMDESTAYQMVYMLRGGVEEDDGTSQSLRFSIIAENNEIGGKTGTTDDASDAWYIGMTHNLVTGIWVGGDEPSIRYPSWQLGSGVRAALPLWESFMRKLYRHTEIGYGPGQFPRPSSALKVTLDCTTTSSDSVYQVVN
jgi:penicillin-binding protein 1A